MNCWLSRSVLIKDIVLFNFKNPIGYCSIPKTMKFLWKIDPKVLYTMHFELGKSDLNWASYECFTRSCLEPGSLGQCESFWVFDLAVVRIWENSKHESGSGQIYLSRMEKISYFEVEISSYDLWKLNLVSDLNGKIR